MSDESLFFYLHNSVYRERNRIAMKYFLVMTYAVDSLKALYLLVLVLFFCLDSVSYLNIL